MCVMNNIPYWFISWVVYDILLYGAISFRVVVSVWEPFKCFSDDIYKSAKNHVGIGLYMHVAIVKCEHWYKHEHD
jgi:hypothetical protein